MRYKAIKFSKKTTIRETISQAIIWAFLSFGEGKHIIRHFLLFSLVLFTPLSSEISDAASEVDECYAEKYRACSSFLTSVEIGEHYPIIDSHISGFTRSKGQWKITVRYKPETTCAKIFFYMDLGPLDSFRKYKRVFRDGGGVISDSGSFAHKIDNLENAFQITNGSCYVPETETVGAISYENGDRYEGGLHNGLPQGRGTMIYADRKRYDGEFHHGLPHGDGKMTWPEGPHLEGEWRRGQLYNGEFKSLFGKHSVIYGELVNYKARNYTRDYIGDGSK